MSLPRAPRVHDISFEIQFQAQKSGGPGGQNVNKTNSSAQLRWPFMESLILSNEQKAIIAHKLAAQINTENVLYIRSQIHRDLEKNKKDALEKLQDLLTKAFFKPKVRRPTKPTRGSVEKRHTTKKRNSEIKKSRSQKWV